jgi:hypothetical protein
VGLSDRFQEDIDVSIHELQNFIPVDTPLGRGDAILIEDADNTYYWTVVLHETRALVTFEQPQLKVTRNYTAGWGFSHEDMRDIIKGFVLRSKNADDLRD